jgi:hypothetical protein
MFSGLAIAALAITAGCTFGSYAAEATDNNQTINNYLPEFRFGPLEQYIVRIVGHPHFDTGAERQAAIDSAMLEAEELIAACMHAQGFTYHIDPTSGITVVDRAAIDFTVPYGSRAWAETYGFGINHPDLYVPPGSDNEVTIFAPSGRPVTVTLPHAEMLETMTPAEQEAWLYALYGDLDSEYRTGCRNVAHSTLWFRQEPATTGFEFLADETWRFWAEIWNPGNPAFSELDNEWRFYMTETGINLRGANNPTELRSILHQEAQEIAQVTRFSPDPEAEPVRRNREIALATAHWDCNQLLDYQNRYRDIQIGLEEEFVARQGTLLEEWARNEENIREAARG